MAFAVLFTWSFLQMSGYQVCFVPRSFWTRSASNSLTYEKGYVYIYIYIILVDYDIRSELVNGLHHVAYLLSIIQTHGLTWMRRPNLISTTQKVVPSTLWPASQKLKDLPFQLVEKADVQNKTAIASFPSMEGKLGVLLGLRKIDCFTSSVPCCSVIELKSKTIK